jgi:hypothetical protein
MLISDTGNELLREHLRPFQAQSTVYMYFIIVLGIKRGLYNMNPHLWNHYNAPDITKYSVKFQGWLCIALQYSE